MALIEEFDMKPQRPEGTPPNVIHLPRGSPVKGVRWPPHFWNALHELSAAHKHQVTVNHIALVTATWGLRWLTRLPPEMQRRVLGVKSKPLTFEEEQNLTRTFTELSSEMDAFRLDARLGFALPTPLKQKVRKLAEKRGTSMSAETRKLIAKET